MAPQILLCACKTDRGLSIGCFHLHSRLLKWSHGEKKDESVLGISWESGKTDIMFGG